MNLLRLASALVVLCFAVGCSKNDPHAGHDHGHTHEHKAPHDGTPVVLGNEAFHLEFVRDAAAGKLSVYVLDGHMENFMRIVAPSLEIVATVNGAPQKLTLNAVADPATGERVGDTSLFAAQADWLKTTDNFDAVLTEIVIRGAMFAGVKFNFPKGNEAAAK